MKRKVCELEGALLDAAVAKAEGYAGFVWSEHGFRPSDDWGDGGPIIESERISISPPTEAFPTWCAGIWDASERISFGVRVRPGYRESELRGPTPLIAAMRAYVASRFGDEVELP